MDQKTNGHIDKRDKIERKKDKIDKNWKKVDKNDKVYQVQQFRSNSTI